MRPADFARTSHDHRFHVLCTEDRSTAAAAGMPAVVRNRGVQDLVLAGGADHGELETARIAFLQSLLRGRTLQAPEVAGRFQVNVAFVNNHDRWDRGLARQYDRIVSCLLAGDGKPAAGEGIVDALG